MSSIVMHYFISKHSQYYGLVLANIQCKEVSQFSP